MAIPLSDNIQNNSNKPDINKYGPYVSLAAALASQNIALAYRHLGLTIGILSGSEIAEYWWQKGVTDGDLTLKSSPSESPEEYTATLPTFQVNNTAETTDAAYEVGTVVKYVIADVIRLFEAQVTFDGTGNPAPTGESSDTNWKEVSPAISSLNISRYSLSKDYSTTPYKAGEMVVDGYPMANSNYPVLGEIYRRTATAYVSGVALMPLADYSGKYWENISSDIANTERYVFLFPEVGGIELHGSCAFYSGNRTESGYTYFTVDRARANNATTMPCVGLACNGRSVDGVFFMNLVKRGIVEYVNTSGMAAGDTLYVSTATAAAFTNVKPTTGYVQEIGRVLKVHATQGVIMVDIKPVGTTGAANTVFTNPNSTTGPYEGMEIPENSVLGRFEADLEPVEIVELFITNPTLISALNNEANWSSGTYAAGIGSQGFEYVDPSGNSDYTYKCINDAGVWRRTPFNKTYIDVWGMPSSEKTKLTNTSNWTGATYTGTALVGVSAGQRAYNATYLFEIADDLTPIRTARA